MGALIIDDANAAFIAHQNLRLAADEGPHIVAGFTNLALVADIDPRGAEDPLHLGFEDGRIGIEPAVHAAGLHQAIEGFVRGHDQSWKNGQRRRITCLRSRCRWRASHRLRLSSKPPYSSRLLVSAANPWF